MNKVIEIEKLAILVFYRNTWFGVHWTLKGVFTKCISVCLYIHLSAALDRKLVNRFTLFFNSQKTYLLGTQTPAYNDEDVGEATG